MSEIIDEKVFEYFLDLPEKVRMRMIDKMQPGDRCRLTRCSKKCNKEAKASKNFMYGLTLSRSIRNHSNIGVIYSQDNLKMGFNLEFKKESEDEKKYMICRRLKYIRRTEYWRIELDDSTNLAAFAGKIFQNLMQRYQKSIKFLNVGGEIFREMSLDFDSGIEKFDNLEKMEVHDINVSKLFSKLTRPLSYLVHIDRKNRNSLTEYEETYQVKDQLIAGLIQLNNEQFRRLSAATISIHIGALTEMNIFQFVKAWQRGEVRENFKNCQWKLSDSKFDVQTLYSLFGVRMVDYGMTRLSLDIVHDKDPSKIFILAKHGYKEMKTLYFTDKKSNPLFCY